MYGSVIQFSVKRCKDYTEGLRTIYWYLNFLGKKIISNDITIKCHCFTNQSNLVLTDVFVFLITPGSRIMELS